VSNVFHSTATTPALTLDRVVSEACQSSIEPTHIAVDVEATSHAIGSHVQFVRVPDVGVPRTGVASVGLVSRTNFPVPVPVYSRLVMW